MVRDRFLSSVTHSERNRCLPPISAVSLCNLYIETAMIPKVLTFLAAVLAVSVAYPTVKTWTLNELSYTVGSNEEDLAMRPYYHTAINVIMYALFTGKNEETVTALAISPSGHRKWTVEELRSGSRDPAYNITLQPYIDASLSYISQTKESEVEVLAPAQDISTWTLPDILEFIEDPNTNPDLMPYLEQAKKDMRNSMTDGVEKENVSMVTPVGLVPMKSGKPRFVPKTY